MVRDLVVATYHCTPKTWNSPEREVNAQSIFVKQINESYRVVYGKIQPLRHLSAENKNSTGPYLYFWGLGVLFVLFC